MTETKQPVVRYVPLKFSSIGKWIYFTIRDQSPFVCSVNFLHNITVATYQFMGNPLGEDHEPVPASVYVNKPLQVQKRNSELR